MRCVTLGICVFIATCAIEARMPKDKDPDQNGRPKAAGGVNLYSLSHEVQLGRELARDVEREVRIVEDPMLAEYVNRIGQNLAHNSDSHFLFSVKIIRSDEINAFTLPGGHVYITTGLIRAADNEAELASALSHEIAHVAARHYTRQASLEQIVSVASIPLLFIGGWPGFVIQHGVEIATPLAYKKTSRMAEAQADRLGLQYMYQTGYDPTAFIDFFERIAQGKDSHTGLFAKLLESHPGLQSRIRAAQKQLQVPANFAPRSRYLIQTSEFEVVKHRLTEIEKGTALPWPRRRVESFDTPPVLRRHD